MNSFLAPAAAIMNRMRYSQKFALITLIVFVPMMILATMLLQRIHDEINVTRQEQLGLQYLKQSRQLLQHIAQHRAMTGAYLNGDQSFQSKIMDKRGTVDAAFTKLKEMESSENTRLELNSELSALQSKWETIKNSSMSMSPPESLKTHTALLADVLDYNARIADNSQMSLDGHADAFYLGDILTNKLPLALESLGQGRGLGVSIAAKGEITPEQKTKISVLLDRVNIAIQSVKFEAKLATKHDVGLQAKLDKGFEEGAAAIAMLTNFYTTAFIDATAIQVKPNEVFDTATFAIDKSFENYDSALPELGALYNARIASGTKAMWLDGGLAVAVLGLVAYMFGGLYSSIETNIVQTGQAAQRLAGGTAPGRRRSHHSPHH
ncbi:MAG: nitrate- and nitrite sensing domain-containing protein [Gammaproteobacteria bacterium]|nr:nitrate- and nitrite sensing domain-containing protein [Gammaproteobacteria bacterium]